MKISKLTRKRIFSLLGVIFLTLILALKVSLVKEATATGVVSLNFPYQIPVLVLKYFPVDPNDPTKIDRNITGTDLPEGTTLEQLRQKIDQLTRDVATSLTKGSAFHGYKDASAPSALNYQIYEEKEFLKPIPVESGNTPPPADHIKVLTGEGFDICDYVENRGVKEVWIWMYHSSHVYPVESYQRGPFGGLGNGFMNLPLCQKTYTVFDYNHGRGLGEAIEDHTHHLESLFGLVDGNTWGRFVGSITEPFACGWTHCPPNVMDSCPNHNYDWANEKAVLSDCEDWLKDRSGEKKSVSCHTWAGTTCGNDSGDKFKVWWMQNIPKNWWFFIGDFDGAKQTGKSLDDLLPTPTPTSCPRGTLGNLNCDSAGLINAFDLNILLGVWAANGPVPSPSPSERNADISGPAGSPDGKVNAFDLNQLLSNW